MNSMKHLHLQIGTQMTITLELNQHTVTDRGTLMNKRQGQRDKLHGNCDMYICNFQSFLKVYFPLLRHPASNSNGKFPSSNLNRLPPLVGACLPLVSVRC